MELLLQPVQPAACSAVKAAMQKIVDILIGGMIYVNA